MSELIEVILEHRLEHEGKETRCACGLTFLRVEAWARHAAEEVRQVVAEAAE